MGEAKRRRKEIEALKSRSVITEAEFKLALEARLAKRLETQTFDEITCRGSKLHFDMELAIDTYPFVIPEDKDEADYTVLLTNEQYTSGRYDNAIEQVFNSAMTR